MLLLMPANIGFIAAISSGLRFERADQLRDAAELAKTVARRGSKVTTHGGRERSTLAVEIANENGIADVAHIPGGFRTWKALGGAVEDV